MSFNISVPKQVILLCRALRENGQEAFMVGGCVRDHLLGLTPNDYDITTSCLPNMVVQIFESEGFKVIPVGLKHGTVSVLVDDVTYEITTYRHERGYSDGRHPDSVSFINDVRLDLERRDFTFNAFAYDPLTNNFVDCFNGAEDIRQGIVRAIGDPEKRFGEDYLRMLRAVRYAARFAYKIEPETFAAIQLHAKDIHKISQERVLSELIKMAGEKGKVFINALTLLKETGLLREILPEIDIMSEFDHEPDTHPEGDVWEHTLSCMAQNKADNHLLNLAILFHDVGKPKVYSKEGNKIRYLNHHEAGGAVVNEVAHRLRMSSDLKESIKFAAIHHMKFHEILEMSNHKLMQLILDKNWEVLYQTAYCDDASRLHLFEKDYWQKINKRVEDLRKEYIEKEKYAKLRKAVNGRLVMEIRKIGQGPELGEYIQKTIEWILNNSIDVNDNERIVEFIRNL